MKSLVRAFLAAVALGATACSEETTEFCPEACDIWERCVGWNRDECMAECTAEADWDEDYMKCLRAQSCETLAACE
jgi:hypothetical protein